MARDADIHWCFQCPECGFGHQELGDLVEPDEIYCLVCREEGRLVRLRRWEAEAAEPDPRQLDRSRRRSV